MKLVDILARELKVWPVDCDILEQSFAGMVFHSIQAGIIPVVRLSISDDWRKAKVTRAQWQAAVDALKAEKADEWNGEGLPPVGALCEWKEKTGFSWVKATVLFISESSVVMQREDGFEWQMLTKRTVFRPIRTPEQIAADERDRSISEMREIWNFAASSGADPFIALHSAGYRKFEIVDN